MINNLKMTALDYLYTDASARSERLRLKRTTSANRPSAMPEAKRLLVDVSVIIRGDARTGIQRVVRAILSELHLNPPDGYSICPVFATEQHGYQHAPESFSLGNDNVSDLSATCKRVSAGSGDIFLGLDLAAALLPKHQAQLERWKLKGTKVHIFVYDLLPVLRPEWFHVRTTRNFYRWLRTLAIVADSAVCISNSVKDDLASWLKAKYTISSKLLPIKVISMGCNLESSVPSRGLPTDAAQFLELFAEAPSALIVGTLEPRKGHQKILNAFERLWQQGHSYRLIMVGKPGWKTDKLQYNLNNHPEFGKRLFWLKNVSDEYLSQIYQAIQGVIIASEGEGFGLPLVEAAKYDKPVLVRNLPVFRELNVPGVYFDDDGVQALSRILDEWFKTPYGSPTQSGKNYKIQWRETVNELLFQIGIDLENSINPAKQCVGAS
jgi:glycosyltransferase involved in cell wall biosynthesis